MRRKVSVLIMGFVVALLFSFNFVISRMFIRTQYVPRDRIFFVESSGRDTLNFRQSCSVESAARQNRNRQIQILMACRQPNFSSPSLGLLGEYDNIVVEPFILDDVFNNTPLEKWYRNGTWKTSPYRLAHMADYLRILFSHTDGGLYLDLDFVVTRSLEGLRNFVVYGGELYFANGVFHFDKGHPIVDRMMVALSRAYRPDVWAAQGPDMVTEVIVANCNLTEDFASGPSCGPGVRLLYETSFFPVHFNDKEQLFQNNTSYDLPQHLTENYAIHAWNSETTEMPIHVGSSQYYAILAAKFCPLTFAGALSQF